MEIQDAKRYVDIFYGDGHAREETVELISALPVNGDRSDLFAYIDLKYHKMERGDYNLTDLGNAERLFSRNKGKVRYCWDTGRWLLWTGKLWQWDEGPKIKVIAKQTARNIYHEAAKAGSPEEAEKIAKHAHASESEARLSAMVTLAQSAALPSELPRR